MPNCHQCNAELTILHPWNSEGDILTCTTPFCRLENRPQGWQPNPQNKALFVNYYESVLGHVDGRRGKRPKYCFGKPLEVV